MADRSKIEWTDSSWTPIRAVNRATGKPGWHCEHVSPGCKHCYAEAMNLRLGTGLPFKPGHVLDVEIRLDQGLLERPIRWTRPRMIFVCSMTDLFGEFVPTDVIDYVFAVMALCPRHTFQVVTKRSARMRAYLSDPATVRRVYEAACDLAVDLQLTNVVLVAPGMAIDLAPAGPRVHLDTWPLPNVWVGVSTEDQRRLDERAPDLIAAPAAVRFLSAEPLLGALNCQSVPYPEPEDAGRRGNILEWHEVAGALGQCVAAIAPIDWVIVGGESGREARPMHPEWARSLRDQCTAAGVPFFFKQWGEYGPCELQPPGGPSPLSVVTSDGEHLTGASAVAGRPDDRNAEIIARFGKKAAGRLLDGVEHNGMPDRAPALAGTA